MEDRQNLVDPGDIFNIVWGFDHPFINNDDSVRFTIRVTETFVNKLFFPGMYYNLIAVGGYNFLSMIRRKKWEIPALIQIFLYL